MSLAHPPKNQLIAFGQGKLAPDESLSIETHLEGCPECCETLLDLKDDTFTGLVRQAQKINVAEKNRPIILPSASDPMADGRPTDASRQARTPVAESGESDSRGDGPTELREHPRYRIVELIGRGGMGSVYRAEHRLMNRTVAIKLVNSQLVRHPQAVERFRREMQAAAKLSHPNIVTAYDAEQAGDAHFLVMEYVDGVDLATIVKNRGPLPVPEACRCARQAADGLQHAHQQGMVHRDIKPHNLMLSAAGQVRILDFGLAGFATESALGVSERQTADGSAIAKEAAGVTAAPEDRGYAAAAAHLTAMGSVMGTPDYIAPEQAVDAHAADIRANIYSLGCTLHFLLTGKPPFEADNVLMKLKAHAEQSPPTLTALRNDVPAELANVVARMMAKNPAERFQTPAEVANALTPFAQPAAQPAAVPPKRRARTLIAAALLGAAALLAAVIYVEFDKGQFIVEPADDQVAVMIGEKGLKIRDAAADREYRIKPGTQRVRSGEYELDVTELPAGLEVKTTKFVLKRGNVERVRVMYKLAAKFSQGPAVAAAIPDEQRLQDSWIAVAGHTREQPIPAEQLVKFSITFDGGQVTIAQPGNPPEVRRGTFKINATSTPKRIDFVAAGKKKTMPGIYEFDGERLKLAVVDGDYARPTDFSPSDRPDHMTGVFERAPLTGASETVRDPTAGMNGSFEVTKLGLPVNWSMYTPRTVLEGDFDIVIDTTDFKEGKQSLKFVVRKCDSTGGRLSPGFFNELDHTKPGETYKISFWAKNAGSEFVFKARGVSASGGEPGVVIRSKETINAWRRFECTNTIPPKMWLRLELNVVQPGTFWMDDIQIVKANDNAE